MKYSVFTVFSNLYSTFLRNCWSFGPIIKSYRGNMTPCKLTGLD